MVLGKVWQIGCLVLALSLLAACKQEEKQQSTQNSASPTTPANRAPTISGTPPASVTVGVEYLFRPTASDPDGNSLTFSVANLPSWASFDAATGTMRGTPAAGHLGSYANVAISVSDGSLSASLTPFTIQVQAATVANRAPTISGTPPASVNSGSAYAFVPTASDPDGNTLTFSATNLPSWLSINTSTGALSGTPTSAQAGTYSGITITVTDGSLSASLPQFSVQVVAPVATNNSASLTWTAPTQRVDGTALSNLVGFKVHVGQSPRTYSQTITIQSATATSYTVTGLGSGTYYFAVSATDSAGLSSDLSAEVSKTF